MLVDSTPKNQRAQGRPKLYLLYHELTTNKTPYTYALETKEFATHVDAFARIRSESLSAFFPEITFDDGHISNAESALPILETRNIVGRFFLTVGWIGEKKGYMDWQDVRTLCQAGQQIGAHGWSHTLLTQCGPKDLAHELRDARITIEDKLGIPITTMSLPGGRSNKQVLHACKEAGYVQVYTSVPKAEFAPGEFLVGRLNILSGMKLEWIQNLLDHGRGTLSALERQYRIKAAAKMLVGDRFYATIWAHLNRKGSDIDRGETGTHEDSAHYQ